MKTSSIEVYQQGGGGVLRWCRSLLSSSVKGASRGSSTPSLQSYSSTSSTTNSANVTPKFDNNLGSNAYNSFSNSNKNISAGGGSDSNNSKINSNSSNSNNSDGVPHEFEFTEEPSTSFFKDKFVIKGQILATISRDGGKEEIIRASSSGRFRFDERQEGQVVESGRPLGTLTSCSHPIISGSSNLCVNCGESLSVDFCRSNDMSLTILNGKKVYISKSETAIVEDSRRAALMHSRKLALVLDLDQTLLHAIKKEMFPQLINCSSAIEQRQFLDSLGSDISVINIWEKLAVFFVGLEVQVEGLSKNSEKKRGVIINMHDGYGVDIRYKDGSIDYGVPKKRLGLMKEYVIKFRPNVFQFIEQVSKICQLGIYTAGTREYAEEIARILDPQSKYFNGRIVSRSDLSDDDVHSMPLDRDFKDLKHLYLGDISMALVLDDRVDVWKKSQNVNVIQVKPYFFYYFEKAIREKNSNNGSTLAVPLFAISLSSDPPGSRLDGIGAEHFDDQLQRSLEVIRDVHLRYYGGLGLDTSSANSDSTSISGSDNSGDSTIVSIGNLAGAQIPQCISPASMATPTGPITPGVSSAVGAPNETLSIETSKVSAASIIRGMTRGVLKGCVIVFSGISQNDALGQDLWALAKSLGGKIDNEVSSRTTHLIALSPDSRQVRDCVERKNIWIVHFHWLWHCKWILKRSLERTFSLIELTSDNLPKPILLEVDVDSDDEHSEVENMGNRDCSIDDSSISVDQKEDVGALLDICMDNPNRISFSEDSDSDSDDNSSSGDIGLFIDNDTSDDEASLDSNFDRLYPSDEEETYNSNIKTPGMRFFGNTEVTSGEPSSSTSNKRQRSVPKDLASLFDRKLCHPDSVLDFEPYNFDSEESSPVNGSQKKFKADFNSDDLSGAVGSSNRDAQLQRRGDASTAAQASRRPPPNSVLQTALPTVIPATSRSLFDDEDEDDEDEEEYD